MSRDTFQIAPAAYATSPLPIYVHIPMNVPIHCQRRPNTTLPFNASIAICTCLLFAANTRPSVFGTQNKLLSEILFIYPETYGKPFYQSVVLNAIFFAKAVASELCLGKPTEWTYQKARLLCSNHSEPVGSASPPAEHFQPERHPAPQGQGGHCYKLPSVCTIISIHVEKGLSTYIWVSGIPLIRIDCSLKLTSFMFYCLLHIQSRVNQCTVYCSHFIVLLLT